MGPLKVGTTLSNKYKIERLLAESGGVILYEATDTAHAKRVWVKILEREALANSAALARFQREAGGAKVLDVGKSEGGLPYMVASEFHPDEAEPAPVPKAVPARGPKTTLPGVAPPPAPLAAKEDEEAPPSSIPLLDDDDLVVAEETPAPAAAVKAAKAKPKSSPPPVLVSPLLSPADMPVLASPLITTPPPPHDDPEVEVEVEDEAATVPLKPPKASQTPTIRIRDLPPSPPPVGRWLVSIIIVASLTGILGFYLGQKDLHPTAAPSESPTTSASLVPDEKTQAPSTTPSATTAATIEPIPSLTIATSTSAATSASAASTASTAPPATTETATVAEAKPPVHATPPVHTNTSPPPVLTTTTTRKPPPAHATTTSDPLTL